MEQLRVFDDLGTRLLCAPDVLHRKIGQVKALLFDWDGVFNDGWKDAEGGSPFSEVGSMGVNLMRFAFWQIERRMLPCGIITGQHNLLAERFAQREHFNDVFMGFTHKPDAFDRYLERHGLESHRVAFFFDDVLDIPVARRCGLRILIGRDASPVLTEHISAQGDAEIITRLSGGEHGLREACELLLSLLGRSSETLEHRIRYSEVYREYLEQRAAITTEVVRNTR